MVKIFKTYTSFIILINVVMFLLSIILISIFGEQTIYTVLALQPAAVIAGKNLWTILTSVFMHASFTHLFVNMFSLFFVGSFVEKLIGKKRFLVFYLISGIFAGVFFTLLSGFFGNTMLGAKVFGDPLIFGLGASGAIFGLIGLLAVLTPYNRVYLIGGPLIAIILELVLDAAFPNSAIVSAISLIVSAYIIVSIFLMLSINPKMRRFALPIKLTFWALPIISIVPLIIIGLFVALPIGNMAHLGGLIAGLIYGFYLRKKYPNKTKMISKMFSQ